MDNWKHTTFSEIADLKKNIWKPSTDDVFQYVGLEHIQQDKLRLAGNGLSTEVNSNKFYFEVGDILFGKLRPYFRKVYFAEFEGVCSTDIWVIEPKSGVGKKFLFYFVANKDFVDLSNSGESGTRMPRADWNFMATTSWVLPPPSEQEAIAEVLSSLDDKIDLLHKQNQKLEELAEILYRQWFIVEANPEGDEVFLSDVADHHKKNIKPFEDPFQEYFHYSIPAFDDGQNPQIELGDTIRSNKYQVLTNSILISKLNPRFPRVWQISKPIDEKVSICSTEFQVVVPHEQRWFPFIYYFLKSRPVTDELIGAAGGTSGSHQRVSPDDIFNLSFIQPDDARLNQFHKIVSPNLEKINNNREQILKLEKLRNTLLPKLMSGEVRVKMKA